MKEMLYFALVQSVEYWLVVLGGTYMSNTIKLERTQNIILRNILNKERRSSSEPLYKELNLLTMKIYFIKLETYAIKYKHFWEQYVNDYPSRSDTNLQVPKAKTEFYKKIFI